MKFHTLTRRAAAAGAASALVAGALVGATGSAAQATPITNTYTCEGTSGPFPVTLQSDAPGIEAFPSISAGFNVPAGLLTLTNTFTIPSAVITTAAGLGITELSSPNFAGRVGSTRIPVDGVSADLADATDIGGGLHTFTTGGTNRAFEIPAAGAYDVLSPSAFRIDAKNVTGATVISIPCTLATGTSAGSYHSLQVTKNTSTTVAKAPTKAVPKGKAAAVAVTVKAPNQRPTGTVVLKKGTKTLAKGTLNKKGKAVIKVKKGLKVGKNKLVALYKGDGYTKPSKSKAVTVKVKR